MSQSYSPSICKMTDAAQINVDVTAPGAIIALGLMYLKVNLLTSARWLYISLITAEVVARSAAWLGRGLSCVCVQGTENVSCPSFDLTPAQVMLNFGLDYKGNVCGDKHKDFNLHELELKYYVNPNQVYQSGLKNSGVKLSNARTICLLDFPIPSDDSLNWVCSYPEGDIRISLDDWFDMNYDYFADLTPELRNTSLQLQGPCYPVIFSSFIDRPSNVSLTHWKQMNGVTIDDGMVIDKSIHNSINARSSVLKRYVADDGKSWPVLIVYGGLLPLFLSLLWLLMIRHFVTAMPWEHHHIRAAAFLMTCVMVVAVLSSIAIVRRIQWQHLY
ncbi:hypothetical protein L1987_48298 [Smallanthus sonchifolius]|uniref:Uncharacterized protein n=1 Tax=Smallanthus sonchifolius TaxID=185202 RepID=A0ACB9FS23_9ASTR|nr:hypothetical protein L1987_48298 [Smallanthus sonchifolius]